MLAFIVSDNEPVTQELRSGLEHEGYQCRCLSSSPTAEPGVLAEASRVRPNLVAVVLSPNPETPMAVLRAIRRNMSVPILAIGPARETKWQLEAIREGADHYLAEEELRGYLEVILARIGPQPVRVERLLHRGQIIAVLGAASGVGATTLAVNLATALSLQHRSCGLVDLKLGGGDLSTLLNVKPRHTIAELCASAASMDETMLERSLTRHESGVALLAPPQSFTQIKEVTPQGVHKAIALARGLFPYTVVDLDDFFHPEQEQTLRQADRILLVFRLDFTSLKSTRRTLDFLEEMGISRAKVRLVANRVGQSNELPSWKVEEALRLKIQYQVPDDVKTVNHANNNGNPAVMESPSSKFSRSVTELATNLNVNSY